MKAIGTYFEQVPRTVIDKILAQQSPPAEMEPEADEPVKNWAAGKASRKVTTRSSKH